jgi:hypothetical protein
MTSSDEIDEFCYGSEDADLLWATTVMLKSCMDDYDSLGDNADESDRFHTLSAAHSSAELILVLDETCGECYWREISKVPGLIETFSIAAKLFGMKHDRDSVIECHRRLSGHMDRLVPRIPNLGDWLNVLQSSR